MSDSESKRILLVEDEALIAMTEKMQLEKYGYSVTTVTTGESAVEAVRTSSDVDLILMDINLGNGIDGTQAAETILRDHDIPIVFLSSHTDPEVVEKTEKISSYGYVVKNSNIAVLDASIKMAFKLFDAKVSVKHHRNRLSDINRIGRLANSTLELDAVLTFILEQTVQALGTCEGMIFLNNPESRSLTWGASVGLSQPFVDDFSRTPIRMGEGLTGRIAETGTPIFIPEDSSHDSRIERAVIHQERLESFIGVPIFADDRVVGVMNILTRPPSRLTEDNVDFCSAIGVQVGSAISNARMYAQQTSAAEELIEARATAIESEEKFRALFEKGPIGVAYHEMVYDESGTAVDYRFLDANSSYRELTGVDPRGKLVTEAFPGIELDPFDWIGTFGRVATTGEEIRFEQHLQPNDRWYDCVGYQVKPHHFVAAFVEITQRKRAEKAMREERHRLAAIIDGTDVGTWEWNVQTGETRFNEKWASIIGYTLDEISPVSIETWQRFAHPEDLKRSAEELEAHFSGDTERYEIEARMRHKDGHWVWVLDRGKVTTRTEDGRPEWIFGTHQEITERKQAEEELQTISKMQSIILRMASQYINKPIEDVDETVNDSLKEIGEFVDADRAYVFEYDWVADVANNTYEWCNEGVHPEIDNLQGVPNSVIHRWVDAHKSGNGIHIDDVMQLPREDGVRQILEAQGVKSVLALPMMRDGRCIGFVGFDSVRETKEYSETEKSLLNVFSEMLVTIGHRQELEKSLVEAKERAEANSADLAAIVEGTPDSIWSFDRNYDIRHINDRFRTDFHSAFGVVLEKGSNLIDALPEALRPVWKPRYDRVLSNEQLIVTDEVETKNGRRFVQVSFNPIVQDGRVIGGSCFGSDITIRKEAELEIQKQLNEKETLLREVHHRVKNNMATIESLLSLQAGATAHPEVKKALKDTISRVQSSRILYEKLLVSDNLNEVSIAPYANGLIDAIVTVFDLENKITIERHIADFGISAKKAFFLGIIINELLTNVFKYAFKDRDGGTVRVSVGKDERAVTLSITDDGVGFDEKTWDSASPGFGRTVVRMLVEQSGGTYRQWNESGARSVVRFET